MCGTAIPAAGLPLHYQWFRGSSGNTDHPISGATSPTYTTPQLSETTTYWVRVNNACGAANSVTATITVRNRIRPHVS